MNSLLAVVGAVFLAVAPAFADELSGEAIYAKKCASCHGAKGEGTKEHPDPLAGDRSLDRLGPHIQRTMPEDAPKTLSTDDAKRVAEYIHGAFYSVAARARNRPPRVELSRLTVRQHRNAVADLIAGFLEPGVWDERRGLRAEYFSGARRLRDDRRVLERVVPVVDFKYGAGSPAEKVNPEEFSVRFSGGLFAPDTGEYEFVVETENGMRLSVNDDVPVIDAWVRSGDERKHRATVFLLGGRVYPLRLEFFKAKKEPSCSIALRWKPPHRVEELVPERSLSPARFPSTLVLSTPFPPDDRSMGFERGIGVSKEWDEAATSAALEVAGYVSTRLPALAGVRADGPEANLARLRDWTRRFVERAFRRPLGPDEAAFFVDRRFKETADLEAAVKTVLLLALKSPRFLYAETGGPDVDGYDVAERLAFGLWDSLPDRELLEAAKHGGLTSPAGVAKQADRMVSDLRARAKLRGFFHHWLQLDRLHELSKDPTRFPEFDAAVVADLRTSLDLLLEDVAWSESSDFRQLLLSDAVYLNGRLSKLYGGGLPADAPFQKVSLGADKHAGVLTHPLLMAGFADPSSGSPIHRGVFIARSVLGRRLRPPPDAVVAVGEDAHPGLTTRERTALQTKSQACQSCHTLINPLGFALEHFDAVGRWRADEKGKPVDASGSYETPTGAVVAFKGARQLAEAMAKSDETRAAFVEHLFHALVRQPMLAYGLDRPAELQAAFAKKEYSIRKLMVDVMAATATTTKRRSP